jgi:hypothetical protein
VQYPIRSNPFIFLMEVPCGLARFRGLEMGIKGTRAGRSRQRCRAAALYQVVADSRQPTGTAAWAKIKGHLPPEVERSMPRASTEIEHAFFLNWLSRFLSFFPPNFWLAICQFYVMDRILDSSLDTFSICKLQKLWERPLREESIAS